MSQHLFIITGASRGLGLALARQLLAPEHQLLCISRHTAAALDQQARQTGAKVCQLSLNLAQPQAAAEHMRHWLLTDNRLQQAASATLINNAAILPAIAPLEDCDAADLSQTLRVGLEASLILTAAFLAASKTYAGMRKVLNISSGLGRRAMASQAAYCAVKAGLDHFTRCVALDQALQANGARVCSLAPGVIDTDMQLHLRQARPKLFPDREMFVKLQSQQQLASADAAATQILAYLHSPDFGSQAVADIRQINISN